MGREQLDHAAQPTTTHRLVRDLINVSALSGAHCEDIDRAFLFDEFIDDADLADTEPPAPCQVEALMVPERFSKLRGAFELPDLPRHPLLICST